MKSILIASTLLLSAGLAAAQDTRTAAAKPDAADRAHVIVAVPNAITWGPAPASLPAGAQLAVIEGDPGKPGLFTMRLRMPSGYRIPPHFHPTDEHVTVLQGTFLVGMGETWDAAKLSPLPTGTFGMIPTGHRHFAQARGEVIIQLHGVGPWSLSYVNPADDPRSKAK